MKILVVSNLYPPHHLGGYEIGCRDIVEKLRTRGHEVQVLTSSFRVSDRPDSGDESVERSLHFRPDADSASHDKREECGKLTDALARLVPDIVFFSNIAGLCVWLPVVARRRGFKTVFFLSDTAFVSWRVGAWLARFAAGETPVAKIVRGLFGTTFLVRGWPVVQGQVCIFTSRFLWNAGEQAGIHFARDQSAVVHWGIESGLFTAVPRERWPIRRLLFVGRISPQKGVRTAISAVARLSREPGLSELTLTLAGGGPDHEYIREMHELPGELGIADRVIFLGNIPREELPAKYAEHDALVFPSEWEEPFAITPLEAMAGGLAIVGTTTGGSGELLRNRETAMTFSAGDAADCARAIRELAADSNLYEHIRSNAQREVTERFTLDGMIDILEAVLNRTAVPRTISNDAQ